MVDRGRPQNSAGNSKGQVVVSSRAMCASRSLERNAANWYMSPNEAACAVPRHDRLCESLENQETSVPGRDRRSTQRLLAAIEKARSLGV